MAININEVIQTMEIIQEIFDQMKQIVGLWKKGKVVTQDLEFPFTDEFKLQLINKYLELKVQYDLKNQELPGNSQ